MKSPNDQVEENDDDDKVVINVEAKSLNRTVGELAASQQAVNEAMIERMFDTVERGHLAQYKINSEGKLLPDYSNHLRDDGEVEPIEHFNSLSRIYGLGRDASVQQLQNMQVKASSATEGDSSVLDINGSIALTEELAAQNPLEGLLITQIVATYSANMEMLGKMRRAGTLEKMEVYGKLTDKLGRVLTQQIALLNKLRTGGKQSVVVKHVHVESGAQAIVGDVHTNLESGGDT